MLTCAELRAKYPKPKRSPITFSPKLSVRDYCVGGAIYREYKRETRGPNYRIRPSLNMCFPSVTLVATSLMQRNTQLPLADAQKFASIIITLNDRGYFDTAWRVVEELTTRTGVSRALARELHNTYAYHGRVLIFNVKEDVSEAINWFASITDTGDLQYTQELAQVCSHSSFLADKQEQTSLVS